MNWFEIILKFQETKKYLECDNNLPLTWGRKIHSECSVAYILHVFGLTFL